MFHMFDVSRVNKSLLNGIKLRFLIEMAKTLNDKDG